MKLKDVIKHLDGLTDTELYVENTLVWSGETLLIAAAADTYKNRKNFIKDCSQDKEYETIAAVLCAKEYLKYKLDSTIEGEAITAISYTNKYGVTRTVFKIDLKK